MVTKPAACSRLPHRRPPSSLWEPLPTFRASEADAQMRAALPRANFSEKRVPSAWPLVRSPKRWAPSWEVGKGFSETQRPVGHATHCQGPRPRSLRLLITSVFTLPALQTQEIRPRGRPSSGRERSPEHIRGFTRFTNAHPFGMSPFRDLA